MNIETLQLTAGSFSSLIFIFANITMLAKVWRTKDVDSFSLTMVVLNNVGNIVYWLYVSSLPIGPIWFTHTFYTVSTLMLLAWCLKYRGKRDYFRKDNARRDYGDLTHTGEFSGLHV